MAQYVEISTGQNGYAADQVANYAITLEDFIAGLQEMIDDGVDPNTKVIMRAYGRGAVFEPVTQSEVVDDEEEEDYI
jgi:hypothetical protein